MKISVKHWLQLTTISGMIVLAAFSQPTWGQVKQDNLLPEIYLAQDAGKQETVNGALDSSSQKTDNGHYFTFHTLEGEAGTKLNIQVNSGDFVPVLGLLDTEGNEVAADKNQEKDQQAGFSVTLPATGTYYIIVVAANVETTGNYTLTVSEF